MTDFTPINRRGNTVAGPENSGAKADADSNRSLRKNPLPDARVPTLAAGSGHAAALRGHTDLTFSEDVENGFEPVSAKAQPVSPPPDAFNGAKPDRPALIKIL